MKSSAAKAGSGRASTYRCSRPLGMQRDGEHTGSVAISQEQLDNHIARRIFALIPHATDGSAVTDILLEVQKRLGQSREAPETARELSALVAERADAARALENLYDMQSSYMGNEIGRKRFATEVATRQERMHAAEQRIAALAESDSPTLPIESWLERDSNFCGDPIGPGTWWGKSDLSARRELVSLFVDRIEVRKAVSREKGARGDRWKGDRVKILWAGALSLEIAA